MAYLLWLGLFLLVLVAIGGPLWFWRRTAALHRVGAWRVMRLLGGGALLAGLALTVEKALMNWVGEANPALPPAAWGAAVILFFAPLEEALKVAVVWPDYLKRRLVSGRWGAAHAALVSGGFVAAYAPLLHTLAGLPLTGLQLLRWAILLPAHFFFAGVWGYMLGGPRRDRWFGITWLACAFTHGVYNHIVLGRGPAFLVIVVPLLCVMAWGIWKLSQESAPRSTDFLFEAPGWGSMRQAMRREGRPIQIHWIVLGALVTLGVILSCLSLAVYLGHRWGVDFSLVDDAGVEGVVPLALLGTALLVAFPFAAYLVARASGARSVLESAWGAGVAILAVLFLFSVTEPTALVVALAIVPVGFALACVGAWFGLARS